MARQVERIRRPTLGADAHPHADRAAVQDSVLHRLDSSRSILGGCELDHAVTLRAATAVGTYVRDQMMSHSLDDFGALSRSLMEKSFPLTLRQVCVRIIFSDRLQNIPSRRAVQRLGNEPRAT